MMCVKLGYIPIYFAEDIYQYLFAQIQSHKTLHEYPQINYDDVTNHFICFYARREMIFLFVRKKHSYERKIIRQLYVQYFRFLSIY